MLEIDLFAFLDGASAWWWVALALALGAVEVVTFTYFMLWLALGALTVAAMQFVAPETDGTTQIVVFAISTIVYAIAGWARLKARKIGDTVTDGGLNRRAAGLAGRRAVVSAPFRGDIGKVEVDGISWRARLVGIEAGIAPPSPGAVLEIEGAEGTTLTVSPPR